MSASVAGDRFVGVRARERSDGMAWRNRAPRFISNLQIGVRGRLRVRVLSSEHAHFENFRPSKPNARDQYRKLVLVVALVRQSEGRY